MNENHLKPVWTTADFYRVVMELRALDAPDRGVSAPVIDIKTRKRIA